MWKNVWIEKKMTIDKSWRALKEKAPAKICQDYSKKLHFKAESQKRD